MKLTYFAQNLKHLRKRSSITQEQLGNEINLGRTTIANYESGVSSPTDTDVLVRLSHLFQVSIDEMLTRDLSMAFSNNLASGHPISHDSINPLLKDFINEKKILYETTIKMSHYMGTPNVIVVDNQGEEKMVFISSSESMNYILKRNDTAYISSLPYYSLPKFSKETSRVFEVNSNAMEPKFSYLDKVVGNWVPNIEEINDGNVYIILTEKHGILIRRIINKITERESLQLIADTIKYNSQYPIIELHLSEILELWSAQYIISANLSQPVENVYGKIADLEIKIQGLMQSLQEKNKNSSD